MYPSAFLSHFYDFTSKEEKKKKKKTHISVWNHMIYGLDMVAIYPTQHVISIGSAQYLGFQRVHSSSIDSTPKILYCGGGGYKSLIWFYNSHLKPDRTSNIITSGLGSVK